MKMSFIRILFFFASRFLYVCITLDCKNKNLSVCGGGDFWSYAVARRRAGGYLTDLRGLAGGALAFEHTQSGEQAVAGVSAAISAEACGGAEHAGAVPARLHQ